LARPTFGADGGACCFCPCLLSVCPQYRRKVPQSRTAKRNGENGTPGSAGAHKEPPAPLIQNKNKTQFCTKIPENSFFLFHVKEFSSVDPFENNDIISGKKIFKKYLKFKFRAISIFKKFQFFFKDSCGPVLCCQTSVEIQPESSAV
jgi:hypothetical protein